MGEQESNFLAWAVYLDVKMAMNQLISDALYCISESGCP